MNIFKWIENFVDDYKEVEINSVNGTVDKNKEKIFFQEIEHINRSLENLNGSVFKVMILIIGGITTFFYFLIKDFIVLNDNTELANRLLLIGIGTILAILIQTIGAIRIARTEFNNRKKNLLTALAPSLEVKN